MASAERAQGLRPRPTRASLLPSFSVAAVAQLTDGVDPLSPGSRASPCSTADATRILKAVKWNINLAVEAFFQDHAAQANASRGGADQAVKDARDSKLKAIFKEYEGASIRRPACFPTSAAELISRSSGSSSLVRPGQARFHHPPDDRPLLRGDWDRGYGFGYCRLPRLARAQVRVSRRSLSQGLA